MSHAVAPARTGDAILLRGDNNGVTTLTLNRPDKYNALSEEMLDALQRALDDIAKDESVRVLIIAAAGKAFCAGHDLKQMRARPDREYYEGLFKQCGRMMMSIVELPQPVIARVHGVATAAGCQLVGICDLAVAAAQARFAVSGVNLGLFCSTPSVALSRNVPRKQAFEMLVTGDAIDADTALRYGLINRVVPESQLDDEVASLAGAIANKSPAAMRIGKRMFYKQIEQGLEEALVYASEEMACNMMAEDACEGIDAFMEKRKPDWSRS